MLCLSEQILFTQRCEEAISGRSLQELLIELEAQLAGELYGWAAGRVIQYAVHAVLACGAPTVYLFVLPVLLQGTPALT